MVKGITDLAEAKGFIRVYDYRNYSHWQIKGFLKDMGLHLEPIGGYKCNRVSNYKQHYRVVEDKTGKVINSDITNDTLRAFFARRGFPKENINIEENELYDEKGRNIKAKEFLDIVRKLREYETTRNKV